MVMMVKSRYSDEIIEINEKPRYEYDSEYVICPYCGDRKGDCWEWVKTHQIEDQCDVCGATYSYFVEYDPTYYCMPVSPPPDPLAKDPLKSPIPEVTSDATPD
jgi:hypothetical protein